MGIYDTIVLHSSVDIDEFPFNSSHRDLDDGRRRDWQTKDLNPSMDTYAILPARHNTDKNDITGNDKLFLYRRHPPILKWTNKNEGPLEDEYPENVIEDASHWRQVRFTGTIEISTVAEDTRLYSGSLSVHKGEIEDIKLNTEFMDSTKESVSLFPPDYFDIIDIDLESGDAKYKGNNIQKIAEKYYRGQKLDIPDEELLVILRFYQNRTINGKIPEFYQIFSRENGSAKYKGKEINDWMKMSKREMIQAGLSEDIIEIINLYYMFQKDGKLS